MGNFGIETRHFFRRIYRIAGDGAEALSGEQFFPSFRGRHAARAAFADERSIRENGVPEPGGVRERRVDMPVPVHRRRFHEFAGAVEIADQVRGDDDERGGITGFRAEFVSAAPQDKRGMIAETEDIPCRRFFPETRILSASVDIDGEILHDEQSEAVAEFIEAVGFEFPPRPRRGASGFQHCGRARAAIRASPGLRHGNCRPASSCILLQRTLFR